MNSLLGVTDAELDSPSFAPAQSAFQPARAASSPSSALSLKNLRVVYPARKRGEAPKVALKGLSLEVFKGEVFGFLGPNGAGKTTTMNVLLGFVRPTSGSASIFGMDAQNPEARQKLGYLPELTYYYKFLTGRELLRFYAKLFGFKASEAEQRIEKLLKLVEMTAAADKPIRSYSKGMQQRAGLAQALLNDPSLLVLDEPTSGLDPIGRIQVRRIIERLKEEGKTVFFSSHELGEVQAVCDRVAMMCQGELKATGSVTELLETHQLNLEDIFFKIIGVEQEARG